MKRKRILFVGIIVVLMIFVAMGIFGFGCQRKPAVSVEEEVTGEPEEALDELEAEEMVEEKEKTYKTTAEGKITFTRFYRVGNDESYTMNHEIYIMNIDGSEQTNLTNNPAEDSDPSFSPDGSKIVFKFLREE